MKKPSKKLVTKPVRKIKVRSSIKAGKPGTQLNHNPIRV
jgi:hypothetical protein